MRNSSKKIAIVLIISLLSSALHGCGNPSAVSDESTIIVDQTDDSSESVSNSPDVSITVVEESTILDKKESLLSKLADRGNISMTAMVASAVSCDLEDRGYIVQNCLAFTKDESFVSTGLGYYYPEFQMFDGDDYFAMGFANIIGPDDEYVAIPQDNEFIGVEPLSGSIDNNAKYNILAYTCDSLDYDHFIYDNQYVIYYQLDSTTIKYETYDNKIENYDLTLGTLYDFDNDTYIYNADLFDEYETHSGTELFSKEDYSELQKELAELSKQQEENGYYVEELNVVYISPESVQAYISSQETDTFYGYPVSQLESSFGKGTALVYTEEGFQTANYYEQNPEDYDWKSFLGKIGIGCGIILVGAILAPVTGGASFGCALITISKIAVTFAVTSAVTTLAVNTASNMMNGYSFEDAISHAAFAGLDSFADGFVIGAAVGSVGVVTGVIKPVACFAGDTPIAVYSSSGIKYKNIKDIFPGDMVYSFNTETGSVVIKPVTEVFKRQTNRILRININGNVICTTENHPFYNPDNRKWVEASSLHPGDALQLISGKRVEVKEITCENCKDTTVYNFTVDGAHNYYVGYLGILVHNKCSTSIKNARNKGVSDAWKKEVEAVKNGTSKYDWTPDEIKQLLNTGKIEGYQGCHIVDVQANPSLASNPDNIIFLKREVHINIVHGGNTQNLSHWGEIIKVMPQFEEQILAIGGLL